MPRTNVGKLMLLTKKLERRKTKIERRIDNLKREYVNILNTLSKLDNQVLDMLPGIRVSPVVQEATFEKMKEEISASIKPTEAIDIPVVPEDAKLQ